MTNESNECEADNPINPTPKAEKMNRDTTLLKAKITEIAAMLAPANYARNGKHEILDKAELVEIATWIQADYPQTTIAELNTIMQMGAKGVFNPNPEVYLPINSRTIFSWIKQFYAQTTAIQTDARTELLTLQQRGLIPAFDKLKQKPTPPANVENN